MQEKSTATAITLELPQEFVQLCQNDQIEPIAVIKGFIADLCGLTGWVYIERSDGYDSHGVDQCAKAHQYYQLVGEHIAERLQSEKT